MGGHPPDAVMAGLFAATLPLAWASWRFVERPFRAGSGRAAPSRRAVFAGAVAGLALLGAAGAQSVLSDGREAIWRRANPDLAPTCDLLRRAEAGMRDRRDDGACQFNAADLNDAVVARLSACAERHGPALTVLGDSHAIDLYDALHAQMQGRFLFGLTSGGCRPHPPKPTCGYDAFAALAQARPELFGRVIFTQAGFHLLRTRGGATGRRIIAAAPEDGALDPAAYALRGAHVRGAAEYLATLRRHADVVWLGPRLEPHVEDGTLLARGCGARFRLRDGLETLFATLDDRLAAEAAAAGVSYVSQQRLLAFDMAEDFATCDAVFWRDGDHWSPEGAARFGARLAASAALVGPDFARPAP